MDWIRGFQKSIDYIDEHITESLEYEHIAQQMNISSFYYQKIFSIICGISIGEYIRNRRLALAGSELLATDEKIIDIAQKYGYDTQEGFTRAFTRFHGVTPYTARKHSIPLKAFSKLSISISVKGGKKMNYKIEEKDSFKIVAKTQRFTKIEDVNGRKDIPEFWTKCHQDGTVKFLEEIGKKDGALGSNIVGMCMEDSTIVKDFPYSIGAEYNGGRVPEGYEIIEVPATTWAVFGTEGFMLEAIQKLWHQVFTEFFPTSDYKPDKNFDLEIYPMGDMNSEDYHSEIWIAVTKK